MRAPLTLFLLVILIRPLFAQPEPSEPRLRATAIHCGAGTQLLAHIGVRRVVSDGIFGEVAFGGIPKLSSSVREFFGHTLGIGFVPEATRQNGKGTFYSLLYTFLSEDAFSSQLDHHHVVTANVGYISQNEEGWSISGRGGVGFMQSNARFYFFGGYSYTQQFHPWLNLEVAFGYGL